MSEQNSQAEPGWPAEQSPVGEQAVNPAGPQASGYAIAALILSISSWVVCPIVPAIVALVLASLADKDIRAGKATGAGLSTASKIISWINIGVALAALVLGGIVLLIVLIAEASGGVA